MEFDIGLFLSRTTLEHINKQKTRKQNSIRKKKERNKTKKQ